MTALTSTTMRAWLASLLVALLLVPANAAAQDVAISTLTPQQMADFLLRADIVKHARLSKGVTKPTRLTLRDGVLTHDAVFQPIDKTVQREVFRDGRVELGFRDSYHYNIAAYRLAEILGLGDMVPVTVERRWSGARGSLSWWIDAKWDEVERRKEDARPPEELMVAYSNQLHLSRIFSQLVYDTDRNQTNTLITAEWRLYMIDFTRAFRTNDLLQSPATILRCSRDLLARLRALTREQIKAAVGSHLEPAAITGLLARRDKIVERIEQLVAERGEAAVLF